MESSHLDCNAQIERLIRALKKVTKSDCLCEIGDGIPESWIYYWKNKEDTHETGCPKIIAARALGYNVRKI